MRLAVLVLVAVFAAPNVLAGSLPTSFSGPADVARPDCTDRATARIEILPNAVPVTVTVLGDLHPAFLEVDGPCGGTWMLLAQDDHGGYMLYEIGGRTPLHFVGYLWPTYGFPFPTDTWTLDVRLGEPSHETEITSRDLVTR